MKRKDKAMQLKELLVMLALGGPGIALFIGGLKVFEHAGRANIPGGIMVAIGGCLFLAMGYYHYKKDYADSGGKRVLAAFISRTVVVGITAVLLTRLLAK